MANRNNEHYSIKVCYKRQALSLVIQYCCNLTDKLEVLHRLIIIGGESKVNSFNIEIFNECKN